MFSNPLSRFFCRAVHVFPVDENYPGAAIESARRVVEGGNVHVRFPEAWLSPDGRLQRFLPGIGQLLLCSRVPAVPAYIGGAFEALPRNRRIAQLRQVTVAFGAPAPVETLRAAGNGRTDQERIACGDRVSDIHQIPRLGLWQKGPLAAYDAARGQIMTDCH